MLLLFRGVKELVDEDYIMDKDPTTVQIEKNTSKPKAECFGNTLEVLVEIESE